MGQGSGVASTTDIRRVLHALRPLAMIGGFVVMWWCLATGAAQADAGPEHDGGTTNRALAGTVERVVHQPVHRAADRARPHSSAPARVVKAVRHHASSTLSATSSVVRSTPADPIVTRASDTVRSQVRAPVEQARAVLATAPVGGSVIPDLEGATDVVENLPVVGESSTLQGETRPPRSLDNAAELFALLGGAGPATSFDAAFRTALAGQGQAAPSSRSGGGSEGHALLSSGATAASSGQSGSGSGAGAGLCEAGLDITLLATKTPTPSLADWQPAGPAYPPSSSPD